MFLRTFLASSSIFFLGSATHEHGVGRLDIAVSGQEVVVMLTAPGHDLAGFESEPESQADREALSRARMLLDDANALFELHGASCRADAPDLSQIPQASASATDAHDAEHRVDDDAGDHEADYHDAHAGDHEEHGDHHDHDGHGDHDDHETTHRDWSVTYRFECTATPASLQVDVFDHFPDLQSLRVQLATDQGQTGTTLTHASRQVSLVVTAP